MVGRSAFQETIRELLEPHLVMLHHVDISPLLLSFAGCAVAPRMARFGPSASADDDRLQELQVSHDNSVRLAGRCLIFGGLVPCRATLPSLTGDSSD